MTFPDERTDDDHVPHPFATGLDGGSYCTCGWLESTKPSRRPRDRVGMRDVWKLYRDHWSQMHPDRRRSTSPVTSEQEQLFDPTPYDR